MLFVTVIVVFLIKFSKSETSCFPEDFKFGVSTSSYQIEGAWNEGGKGENIWDRFTHSRPNQIIDHSTGNVACDSYNKYEKDIELLNFLGVDFYRFSISWSRILPTGYTNQINRQGIDYYNNLINQLLAYDIEPMVTMYHWDLPQPLQDIGGWTNPLLEEYFVEYSEVIFKHFGDRVRQWITFNEPKLICMYGYGDVKMAPGTNASGIGDYLCGHTILKAHARVYHLYNNTFRAIQNGKIGIALHTEWFQPATGNEPDIQAAHNKLLFDFGWFAHPIYHKTGDYPWIMKDSICNISKYQGFSHSRLPMFTTFEKDYIKGTYDFLGLNMYTASMAKHAPSSIPQTPSFRSDLMVETWKDPKWPGSQAKRLKVCPWALRKLLAWVKKYFGDFPIIITENGYADSGQTNDIERIHYIQKHVSSVLEAIKIDNVSVTGYSVWSLMDNFEWYNGYQDRYGLFHVDFTKANRPRKAKKSAYFYRTLIKKRTPIFDEVYNFGDYKTSNLSLSLLFITIILFM